MPDQYVVFTKEVTPVSAKELVDFMFAQATVGTTKLILAMNSPGGQVPSGIGIYNAMLAMPYDIDTHNIGNVDSVANVIFLGGDVRYANPSGMFMFHGVGFNSPPNARLEEKFLLERLDSIVADHRRMSAIINSRTGNQLSLDQGMELFKEQRTRDAVWARDKGIISEIREFAVPAGVNVHLLT